MPTSTTNYGLIKPGTDDPILIEQLNDNADNIDAALKENADAIENKPDAADIPSPSTAAPAMDGTAAAGTSTDYARADHIHPSDTSKQDVLNSAQLAAVNSGIDSAKVEQIEINKNNISSLTPDIKRVIAFSGDATYSMVSDCTLTLAVDDIAPVYRISGFLGQGSAGIRGIILSKSNNSADFDTDANVLCKAEQSSGIRSTLVCDDIWFNSTDNPRYVYCWVKLAMSGTGRVYTIAEKLG